MCDYIGKKRLKKSKKIFYELMEKVRLEIKKNEKIKFYLLPIGSGKNNLVTTNCSNNFYDLDFQIVVTKNRDILCPKKLKLKFMHYIDENRTEDFDFCEDSTQAITIKNKNNFGFDIIITKKESNIFYILRNDKKENNYSWKKRNEIRNFNLFLKEIKKNNLWKDLRDNYREKKCMQKNQKKSYQILHESINEIIKKIK